MSNERSERMRIIEKFERLFKSKKHSLANLLIHLSAVSLFVLPEVITNIDDQRPVPDGIIIKTIIYLVIFYINYFLIDRFLNIKRGKWHFLGVNVILLFVASCVILITSHGYTDKKFHPVPKPPIHTQVDFHSHKHHTLENKNLGPNLPPPSQSRSVYLHAAGRLSRDLLIAILSIALAFAVRVTTRWVEAQRKQAALIATQRETELDNLKSQINPHFLFNTLNTVYALIAVKPTQAQKAIHELSQLMRYTIYETSEEVTLQQEIDFIKNYVSLMKMRMNVKRPINVSLTCENANDYLIAPLLFIPVIENAFKYGNTGNVENPIKIDISLDDGVVRCYTFNHFDRKPQENASGIGLTNLRQRLNLIYGSAASIATITQDNTYQVEMIINLNRNSSENPSST